MTTANYWDHTEIDNEHSSVYIDFDCPHCGKNNSQTFTVDSTKFDDPIFPMECDECGTPVDVQCD